MKPKRESKKIPNSEKILLIVENSEEAFFNKYFRDYLKKEHQINIHCESSGSNNKCEISNWNKMSNRIDEAIKNDNYRAVFLMVDLNSKCFKKSTSNHTCLIELRDEYRPKYKIDKALKDRFYLFVVCREIESWFLTIDKERNNTNDNSDHKKELNKFFNTDLSEIEMVNKMIKELKNNNHSLNINKNESFEHFINKLKHFTQEI